MRDIVNILQRSGQAKLIVATLSGSDWPVLAVLTAGLLWAAAATGPRSAAWCSRQW